MEKASGGGGRGSGDLTFRLLSLQAAQSRDPRAATSSSTTCRRSLATRSSCRCSCPSGTSSAPRSSSTGPPTRANASVSESLTTTMTEALSLALSEPMLKASSCLRFRLRQLRQPHERPGGDPGHERVSDRHEATQGPAEEAQRRQQALLMIWNKLRLKEDAIKMEGECQRSRSLCGSF